MVNLTVDYQPTPAEMWRWGGQREILGRVGREKVRSSLWEGVEFVLGRLKVRFGKTMRFGGKGGREGGWLGWCLVWMVGDMDEGWRVV